MTINNCWQLSDRDLQYQNKTIDTMKATNETFEPVIKLLEELKTKMDNIESPKRYYRNKDLKMYFGLSDNTILSYRDKNLLPFTKIGDIYYYPIAELETILVKNSNYDLMNNRLNQSA